MNYKVNFMVLTSFLNPLSEEAQNIVREKADLTSVFDVDNDLIKIVSFSPHQKVDDDSLIPKSIIEFAQKRIKWYIERRNNKKYNQHDYEYLFVEDITPYDVIAFHLTAQAIAYKFNFNSREMKLFVDGEGQLIEDRLSTLLLTEKRAVLEEILSQAIQQAQEIAVQF